MTLGRKIVLSFVFLSVLLGALGLLWETYYAQITNEKLKESRDASAVVSYTNEMEVSLYEGLLYLTTIRETEEIEDLELDVQRLPSRSFLIKSYEGVQAEFDSVHIQLEYLLRDDPDLMLHLNEFSNRIQLLKNLIKEWLKLLDEAPNEAKIMFVSSIEPYFLNNIMPKVSELRKETVRAQNEKIAELDAQLNSARKVNQLGSTLALLLGLLLAFYLYRSITSPLKTLMEFTRKIGQGNLKERVKINTKDEFGKLAEAFNSMATGLESKTISTEYLDNVLESIQEAIFVVDNDGIVKRVNGSAASMLGYDREEIIDKPLKGFFYLTDLENELKNTTQDKEVEYNLVTRKKEHIPVLLSEADLIEHGQKVGAVNVASDITKIKQVERELKVAVEEKEMMLAEIHHRVKNNLAVISGLLQLQSYQSDNEEITKALSDSQFRIQSMALVHEMLYKSENLAYIDYRRYINDLLQAIMSMHYTDEKKIHLETGVEKFSLTIAQAIPCSLLINEILVNSFKHAFTNQKEGTITVTAFERNDIVTMYIKDDGKGVSKKEFFKSRSLGATLIKTLTEQLEGTFDILENDGPGTTFYLEFKKDHSPDG